MIGNFVYIVLIAYIAGAGGVQLLFIIHSPRSRWRWWAAAIAYDAVIFAAATLVQFNVGPTQANVVADRVAFAALLGLVPLLLGYTHSYWDGGRPRYLLWLLPINLALMAVTLLTDAAVQAQFDARAVMPFVSDTYWEARGGRFETPIAIYMLGGAMTGLVYWFVKALREPRRYAWYLAGFSVWALLGVSDFVATRFVPHLPPLLAFGFAIFALILVIKAVEEMGVLRAQATEADERATAVLSASPHPVFAIDRDHTIVFANEAFDEVMRWPASRRLDDPEAPIGERSSSRLRAAVADTLRDGRPRTLEIEYRTLRNGLRSAACSIASMRNENGSARAVINLTDITERREREEESRFLASHDPVTGFRNRRSLHERLNQLSAQSRRDRHAVPWALLFMDLDRFKTINDTLGHQVGDQVLIEVARRIEHTVRESDACFRLGGDEFVVVVTNLKRDADALRVAHKLREAVAASLMIGGTELFVELSVGITVCPRDGYDVDTMLKNADFAMYAAKRGGTRIQFFTERLQAQAAERMGIETDLRAAVRREQLDLHYQPIVAPDGEVVEVEALLRWKRRDGPPVSPGRFIPIAEDTGAIIEIGEWVLARAFSDARRFDDNGNPDLPIAVNVSAAQLRNESFVELVDRLVAEYEVRPQRFVLEITETAMLDSLEAVTETMQALRSRGFRFALDDFGTGYASLRHLFGLPIDQVKFDHTFVNTESGAAAGAQIVDGLVDILRSLQLQSVIEGVETAEQLDRLRRLGDVQLQGHHFGRPAPLADVLARLAAE